jgi:GT2 family glycosyltransferase
VSAVAVILNWRGAPATLRCVAAVRAQAGLAGIVVVDNGSGDGSARALAEGIPAACGDPEAKWQAESAGVEMEGVLGIDRIGRTDRPGEPPVYLVRLSRNLGYAGGNNRGMRVAETRLPAEFFWIVNNDTLPTAGALAALLKTAAEDGSAGFVGSVLVYERHPRVVQCYGGGRVHGTLGRTRLSLKGVPLDEIRAGRRAAVDYVMGASMLVRRDMLANVGLMDERYFMYWEDVDWQHRARAAGRHVTVAPDSVVLHGDSASTKGAGSGGDFHYYLARAAVLYRRKHFGWFPAAVTALAVAGIGVAQTWRRPGELRWLIRGARDGLLGRRGGCDGG